ncbi:hypothetical protein PSHT_15580, partial [Puccinia striiformis]
TIPTTQREIITTTLYTHTPIPPSIIARGWSDGHLLPAQLSQFGRHCLQYHVGVEKVWHNTNLVKVVPSTKDVTC